MSSIKDVISLYVYRGKTQGIISNPIALLYITVVSLIVEQTYIKKLMITIMEQIKIKGSHGGPGDNHTKQSKPKEDKYHTILVLCGILKKWSKCILSILS